MRKYIFTGEEKSIAGGTVILKRIRAARSFKNAVEGKLGGWIEKEENLSHNGNAWVANEAQVYNDAYIYGDACIKDNVSVCQNAMILGNALVYNNAMIYGDAIIKDRAHIFDCAHVGGYAQVRCDAYVYGKAYVYGEAVVDDMAQVYGSAKIFDVAAVYQDACVYDDAIVFGDSVVGCNCKIGKNAYITKQNDVLCIGPIGSRDDYTTFYKTESGISVVCGCFKDDLQKFVDRVKEKHSDSIHAKVYLAAAHIAQMQIWESGEKSEDQ